MNQISKSKYIFRGDPEYRSKNPHSDSPGDEPYVASDELIQAVNLAIHLGRPLLLEGEAGCGKTRLAYAVAFELGLPLYRWDVRSTSKAQEGFYEYDALGRLHDVQIQKPGQPSNRDPSQASDYLKFKALGKAFKLKDCPAVVLIDEIDKADIDFPNDLLAVLDPPWEFEIRETGEKIQAKHLPITIITSNREKGNLPAPFLRRCLYSFIHFPDEKTLKDIVDIHYKLWNTPPPKTNLVQIAINHFQDLRKGDIDLLKKPGTSEFLDWLEALQNFEPRAPEFLSWSKVFKDFESGSNPAIPPRHPVPYKELLFKLRTDLENYLRKYPEPVEI